MEYFFRALDVVVKLIPVLSSLPAWLRYSISVWIVVGAVLGVLAVIVRINQGPHPSPLSVESARVDQKIENSLGSVQAGRDININIQAAPPAQPAEKVMVSPSSIRLGTGEMSVKTPVIVTNQSDGPLYSVWVKITIKSKNYGPESVDVFPGQPSTGLQGEIPQAIWSADWVAFDGIDSRGNNAIVIRFPTLGPKQYREFIVEGKSQAESSAEVEVWSFDNKPAEVLQGKGKSAIPFSVPENFTVTAQRAQLKRN